MNDPQTKLGQIITFADAGRDAVHIAVAPVTAAETLYPGQRIGVAGADTEKAHGVSSGSIKAVLGIVDPFLPGPVYEGQRFWMFLLPNTITGLRHEWTHPAFGAVVVPQPEAPPLISASEQWLRDFAASEEVDLTYHALMEGAKDYIDHGEYLVDGGKWEGFHAPDEFWMHYAAVTGTAPPDHRTGNFFACSC